MKIGQLKINPQNPRIIKDERFAKLKKSLQEFPKMMELRPIVYDPATMMILGGNMRFRALQDLGYKDIPASWAKSAKELTEEEKQRFIIEDNVPFGEWDWDILANEWDEVKLAEWGMEIPTYFGNQEAQEDDYKIPDEIQTDIKPGDLFAIGRHRLLCGDSTKAEDVSKLLNGNEPYLMITDPPYGVNYDANWRNEADRANGRPIGARATMKVSNDNISTWKESYSIAPSKVAYLWHASASASAIQFAMDLMECGFEIRNQIIWAKNNIVISRGHYHWKHEPCWYAVKKGEKSQWIGDRSQSTVWEIDKPLKSETGHSTQKPVECMARPIKNHSGDVYDPFLGSGTTMVACEQLNRICYGMEIEPKYCQVIIDRMKKLVPEIEVKKIK